ncbi:MAG: 2Fe-2S iron-sulfur cluster binding domain-containing protein, partial [Dehalococcoidia bacterium]|nr:2Fe-2S iron-sulfur cluster binding domain-containing protein [Dehalococcoidia bacterium]
MNADVSQPVRLRVNGEQREAQAPSTRTLVDLLRYDLGLTGTKEACGVGVCGACTIMLDGRMVASCIVLAAQADGAEIKTIEGIGDAEHLDPVQESFIRNGGFQCGICTPGQIVAARALLDEIP